MGVPKTSDHIQINIRMKNPSQEPPASLKAPNQDWKDMDFLWAFKIKIELKFRILAYQRPVNLNIRMQTLSQEPPASLKAPNQDLKDMDVLCTFKIKIESQNFDHSYIRDQWPYPNQNQDAKFQLGTSIPNQSPKFRLKSRERTKI